DEGGVPQAEAALIGAIEGRYGIFEYPHYEQPGGEIRGIRNRFQSRAVWSFLVWHCSVLVCCGLPLVTVLMHNRRLDTGSASDNSSLPRHYDLVRRRAPAELPSSAAFR